MFLINPNKIMRYPRIDRVFLDIETSGLNPPEAVILSLAFVVDRFDPEKEEYYTLASEEWNVLPTEEEWERASPKALEVNGMTWEFLQENGKPLSEVRYQVSKFIVGHKLTSGNAHLVGQNPSFDIKFFKHYMPDMAWLGFPFDDVLDNIQWAKDLKQYDKTFNPRRLNSHSLSKALGVEEESQVHTALGGAEVVRRNFLAIEQRFLDTFAKMRQAALKGVQYLDEIPEVRLLPTDIGNTLENFTEWARKNEWREIPTEEGTFVDDDGRRWTYFGGNPPILVNRNHYN